MSGQRPWWGMNRHATGRWHVHPWYGLSGGWVARDREGTQRIWADTQHDAMTLARRWALAEEADDMAEMAAWA